MGNIVVSEALRNGAVVEHYAACQSAMAAHAYGLGGGLDRQPTLWWTTSESYAAHPTIDGFFVPYFAAITGKMYNFYNPLDAALSGWKLVQDFKPDNGEPPGMSPDQGYNSILGLLPTYTNPQNGDSRTLDFPLDTYELYAHVSQARSFAVGAVEHPLIPDNFDLSLGFPTENERFDGSRADHSAQFRGTNMIRHRFWSHLIGPDCFDSPRTRNLESQ